MGVGEIRQRKIKKTYMGAVRVRHGQCQARLYCVLRCDAVNTEDIHWARYRVQDAEYST